MNLDSKSIFGPSSVRYWLMALVLLQWAVGFLAIGVSIVVLAKFPSIEAELTKGDEVTGLGEAEDSSNLRISILFGIVIFCLVVAAVHVIFASFALLAEVRKKPGWLTPWIYYLYVVLVLEVLSGINSVVQLNLSAICSEIVSIGLTVITLMLSKERREQMEISDKGYVINNHAEI